MNRAGFTTIEVMIASVLILALITAGMAGIHQMQILQQVADSRTSHSEVRAMVFSALSDRSTCALHLGNPKLGSPTVLPLDTDHLPIATIPFISDGVAPILVDGKPKPKSFKTAAPDDGLIYRLRLKFVQPNPVDTFPAGLGRADKTERYFARLEIHGERKRLSEGTALGGTEVSGPTTDLVGAIPIALEFDRTYRITSCTLNADEMDDVLYSSGPITHTVRQCYAVNGIPFPTDKGLICRVPVPFPIQQANGYPVGVDWPNGIPTCKFLTGGLLDDVVPTAGFQTNYNTTIPITAPFPQCKGKVNDIATGWHTMGQFPVEHVSVAIKKNAKNKVSILLAGAAFAGIVGNALFPGLGFAIASLLTTVAFIVSLFNRCHNTMIEEYAQVTSVGCQ